VCRRCGSCARNETWFPFAMPIGLARLRHASCKPNQELGKSHTSLPVTHTAPRIDVTHGRWFYYARGCSDLFLHVGATLLAQNKIHAAILLEQRLARTEGSSVSEEAALGRFVHKLRSRFPDFEAWVMKRAASHPRGMQKLYAKHVDLRLEPRNMSTFEGILAAAAQGFFGTLHDTQCNVLWVERDHPDSCRGHCLRRAIALSTVLEDGQRYDMHLVRTMQLLRRTSLPLDTLTLTQQPLGGGSARWTTEILDARDVKNLSGPSRQGKTPQVSAVSLPQVAMAAGLQHDSLSRRYSGPAGSTCARVPTWSRCTACREAGCSDPAYTEIRSPGALRPALQSLNVRPSSAAAGLASTHLKTTQARDGAGTSDGGSSALTGE
jgi:hypothetical protein